MYGCVRASRIDSRARTHSRTHHDAEAEAQGEVVERLPDHTHQVEPCGWISQERSDACPSRPGYHPLKNPTQTPLKQRHIRRTVGPAGLREDGGERPADGVHHQQAQVPVLLFICVGWGGDIGPKNNDDGK